MPSHLRLGSGRAGELCRRRRGGCGAVHSPGFALWVCQGFCSEPGAYCFLPSNSTFREELSEDAGRDPVDCYEEETIQ